MRFLPFQTSPRKVDLVIRSCGSSQIFNSISGSSSYSLWWKGLMESFHGFQLMYIYIVFVSISCAGTMIKLGFMLNSHRNWPCQARQMHPKQALKVTQLATKLEQKDQGSSLSNNALSSPYRHNGWQSEIQERVYTDTCSLLFFCCYAHTPSLFLLFQSSSLYQSPHFLFSLFIFSNLSCASPP
jgi:hypothetical protein